MKDLKEIYDSRRSVNFFDSGRNIDEQLVKNIVDLAVMAPSAYNLQPWRIIEVRSPEAKKKLHQLAFKQPKILKAPVTLILIGNRKGWDENNPAWTELESMIGEKSAAGAKNGAASLYGSTNERRIKFAESNTGLLAMSLMYAAKYHGIDSHPMSGMDSDGIKSAFGLEEEESVVMLLALGYFDNSKKLWDRRKRRDYNDIVTVV